MTFRVLHATTLVAVGVGGMIASTSVRGAAKEPSPARKLKVAHPDGYFSIEAVQDVLAETLGEETKRHLEKGKDAVWVFTASQSLKNGSNYCFASVGLTEATPKGRSARIPANDFSNAVRSNTRGTLSPELLRGCVSDALRGAIKEFAEAGLEKQLEGIERTRSKGTRKPQKASATNSVLYTWSLSNAGKSAIFNAIPVEFSTAFDFRRLQWVALARSFTFGDQVVCFGVGGVTATAPDDRWPRFPGGWTNTIWEMTKAESAKTDAQQTCRDDVALDAVKLRLDKHWDDTGLLQDFKLTKEDGVQLVASYKPKKVDPAREASQFRATVKVGSDSHCGLVTEVKAPIARVQTMVGEIWLKISQLYPKGKKDCRFHNGLYQDPD
jgi:hypothetical protein